MTKKVAPARKGEALEQAALFLRVDRESERLFDEWRLKEPDLSSKDRVRAFANILATRTKAFKERNLFALREQDDMARTSREQPKAKSKRRK